MPRTRPRAGSFARPRNGPSAPSTGPTAPTSGEPAPEQLAEWLHAISHGDEVALGTLYDATSPALYGLALTVLGDPSEAEDVILQIYLEVWRTAGSQLLPGRDNARWLRRIALGHIMSRVSRPRTGATPDHNAGLMVR